MRRAFSLLAGLLLATPLLAQDLVAKTDALTPEDEKKAFTLPPGFEAQLIAAEPDIQKPMQMAFDARGRLWVTTSHIYPFAVAEGKGTDRLYVLSDFDATGKAKSIAVFDDKLNIPIGVLPLPDCKSVIVSECGKILKLTDADGDGKADKREVLFSGFGFRDTHGMTNSFTLLPDGWVYACHGYLNDSTVKGTDGHEVKMNSGNTFRFKPDGSRIEVFTRGQVNPFGIAVDPWLNLYTACCHSKPITQLVRGAYYDSFGKPHDGLGYGPHVTTHQHGSTGLCGLVYYSAEHFPAEYTGRMFLGNVVTSRINLDTIEWKGSSPVAKEQPDFLVSSDPWFRPVDLKLGPDGALYVADFYNKIIGHYEVDLKHPGRDKDHGRLWRIVYTGKKGEPVASAPAFPRKGWTQASADELLTDFGHPNTTVRLLAANEAAGRASFKPSGTDALTDEKLISFRMGLFAMVQERTGEITPVNYQTVIDYAVQQNVKSENLSGLIVKSLVSRTTWEAKERALLLDCLKKFDNIRIKRAVVDGMTAHPHADFVAPLLDLMPKIDPADTHLHHAAKIALRNCIQQPNGWDEAKGKVEKATMAPLVEAVLGTADKKFAEWLAWHSSHIPANRLNDVGRYIGRFGNSTDFSRFADFVLPVRDDDVKNWKSTQFPPLVAVVRGMQESGVPLESNVSSITCLSRAREACLSPNAGVPEAGVELYRELHKLVRKPVDLEAGRRFLPREAFAGRSKLSAEQRAVVAEVFALFGNAGDRVVIRDALTEPALSTTVRDRLLIAIADHPTIDDAALLVQSMKSLPYATSQKVALGLASDAFAAELFLAAVKKGEAPARLLQEKAIVDRLRATKVKDLDARLKELTAGIPTTEKRIDDLIKTRAAGFTKASPDAAKGKEAFTKNCAICHQVDGQGAKVGPQLDGVGVRGLERLLEDTLDPSRHVDVNFRATKLDLKNGQSLTGLLLREEGAVYVVADNLGKEQRVAKDDVDVKSTSGVSAMPANLDTTVPEADYYHLMSYLLTLKPKPTK